MSKINKLHISDRYKVLLLRTLGNFLISISLFFLIKTFSLPVLSEIRYYLDKINQKVYLVTDNNSNNSFYQNNKETSNKSRLAIKKNIEILRPVDVNFGIIVPKIAANSPVVINVNTANKDEYLAALKKGVAHALGTGLPGEGKQIFLFAHSTDYWWNVGTYNAIFYLLYKLENGDEVNLFFDGKRHRYEVFDKKIVEPNEVGYIFSKTDSEVVTLQTCWPPGTTWKRLLVFARKY